MQVYVIFDGQQHGPFEMDELRRMPVTPQTPVWYQGLSDWTAAGEASATRFLFETPDAGPTQAACPDPLPDPPYADCGPLPEPPYLIEGAGEPAQPVAGDARPQHIPNSYMALSILLTILCCLPFGVVACIKSANVSECLEKGDYEGARRNSRAALTWVWVSLIGGVLFYFGVFIFGVSLGAAANV